MVTSESTELVPVNRYEVERQVMNQLKRWRDLLAAKDTASGRQLLREVLDGPLLFHAEGDGYKFTGKLRTGELIAGLAGLPPLVASPTGFEPVFWP